MAAHCVVCRRRRLALAASRRRLLVDAKYYAWAAFVPRLRRYLASAPVLRCRPKFSWLDGQLPARSPAPRLSRWATLWSMGHPRRPIYGSEGSSSSSAPQASPARGRGLMLAACRTPGASSGTHRGLWRVPGGLCGIDALKLTSVAPGGTRRRRCPPRLYTRALHPCRPLAGRVCVP